jgi:cysteine dioxygenase
MVERHKALKTGDPTQFAYGPDPTPSPPTTRSANATVPFKLCFRAQQLVGADWSVASSARVLAQQTMNKHALPFSLRDLIRTLEAEQEMTPRRAGYLLEQADIKEEDLLPWADFDHSSQHSYARHLAFDGGFFEMMVMSWVPGDYSAIHDHGHTQWGAVQVYGPAEHSVFLAQDDELRTLSRTPVRPGQVFAVSHHLVHQMGNPSETNFLTFHLYGCHGMRHDVTSDARVFDLEEHQIQRTDNGVFFAMAEDQVKLREPGPQPDYLTWLRNLTELKNRIDRMRKHNALSPELAQRDQETVRKLSDPANLEWLEQDLMPRVDEDTGHITDLGYWNLLRSELIAAAKLQKSLLLPMGQGDPFFTYAELYDDVIGEPCLEEFIASYLKFVVDKYRLDMETSTLLSIGCGTGIVEEYLISELGVQHDHLMGIDKSEAMVEMASRRIAARAEDVLSLSGQEWDLTYSGLNVFQYLSPDQLEQALEVTAQTTRAGGYFFGDFITPDHIRTYPHVIQSKCGNVLSLRNPLLIERENYTFQQSEVLNVSRKTGQLTITNEGKHLRFLPPLWRLRQAFEEAFKGKVDIYDAVTLDPIGPKADTCPSTRYLIVAHKPA